MDLKAILRRLPPQDGDLKITFEGGVYNMPYETLTIGDHTIPGVRENLSRLALLDRLLTQYGVKRESLLDVGSNLGTTADHFANSFGLVTGIEAQAVYHSLSLDLWAGVRFIHSDLNYTTLGRLLGGEVFSAVLALSVIEYIRDKQTFVEDLFNATEQVCIVEGHSETIYPKGLDGEYEALLKTQPWTVTRIPELTDNGLNAPLHCVGRPVWVCAK